MADVKLEVGKTYLTNTGIAVVIKEYKKFEEDDDMPFFGSNFYWYTIDGIAHGATEEVYLVKELEL